MHRGRRGARPWTRLGTEERMADPRVRSQYALYPSLLMHERELVDLFGADMRELPPGPSYPLPDGWPKGQYPLRKEWNPAYFNKDTMRYEPPEGGGEAKT